VPSRRLSVLVAACAAAAALVVGLVIAIGSGRDRDGCASGFAPLGGEEARELAHGRQVCLKQGARLPETFADLARVNEATGQRFGIDTPQALAAAVRAKGRLARTSIPGTAGTWTPVGKGALRADDTSYSSAASFGLGKLAGRVVDFAYDDAGRQPTAARTAPPECPKRSGPCTTTSVTTLARKQPGLSEFPAQSPVGSATLTYERPASVER